MELKLPLPSEAAYRSLRAGLGKPEGERLQHNMFFDTADRRLAAARWGLRLRKETDPTDKAQPEALLALKGPATHAHGATRRVDLEVPVLLEVWQQAHANGVVSPRTLPTAVRTLLQQVLAGSAHAKMHASGALNGNTVQEELLLRVEFVNLRTRYQVVLAGVPLTLLLDRTEFATGQVDWEVEIELPCSATPDDPDGRVLLIHVRQAALTLLARHGVRDLPPPPGGKLSRALRYLEEHQRKG